MFQNQTIIISFKIFINKRRKIYEQKRKIHFVRELLPSTFLSLYHERQKIVNKYWTMLSKIS